jgi:hypothetical protein
VFRNSSDTEYQDFGWTHGVDNSSLYFSFNDITFTVLNPYSQLYNPLAYFDTNGNLFAL